MVGRADKGVIVCTPLPILKLIGVGAQAGVGVEDRLPKGACTAVAGVGHGEGRLRPMR